MSQLKNPRLNLAAALIFGGLFFAFSPAVLEGIANWADPEDSGAAFLGFFFILTFPVGGVSALVGFFLLFGSIIDMLKKPLSLADSNRSHEMGRRARVVSFLVVPALLSWQVGIAYMFYSVVILFYVFTALGAFAVITGLRYAVKSRAPRLTIAIAATALIWLVAIVWVAGSASERASSAASQNSSEVSMEEATPCPTFVATEVNTIPQEEANLLIGMAESEAEVCALGLNWLWRVGERDGEFYALTMDYRPNRVTVQIQESVIYLVNVG